MLYPTELQGHKPRIIIPQSLSLSNLNGAAKPGEITIYGRQSLVLQKIRGNIDVGIEAELVFAFGTGGIVLIAVAVAQVYQFAVAVRADQVP